MTSLPEVGEGHSFSEFDGRLSSLVGSVSDLEDTFNGFRIVQSSVDSSGQLQSAIWTRPTRSQVRINASLLCVGQVHLCLTWSDSRGLGDTVAGKSRAVCLFRWRQGVNWRRKQTPIGVVTESLDDQRQAGVIMRGGHCLKVWTTKRVNCTWQSRPYRKDWGFRAWQRTWR